MTLNRGGVLLQDERWPVARLIPITSSTGVEAKERNAASALLAVLSQVDESGRILLMPLGLPAGKTSPSTAANRAELSIGANPARLTLRRSEDSCASDRSPT